MTNTEKGKTYRAGSPDLTQFDPIRNTVGNRPAVGTIRARATGATSTVKKGDTVRAAKTTPKRKTQEPSLPRREYPQP